MKTLKRKNKSNSNFNNFDNGVNNNHGEAENSGYYDLSLDKAISRFIDTKTIENVSQSTIDIYEYTFDDFQDFLDEKRDISSIDVNVVKSYLLQLQNSDISDNTVSIHYRNLRAFFNWAVKAEFKESNPLDTIGEPKTDENIPSSLTEDQASKLLKAAKKKTNTWTGFRNYTIIKCFLDMGLRRKELINAKIDDYKIGDSTLLVKGKGRIERKVTCAPETDKTIRKWLKKRNKLDTIYDDTIFISKNGEKLKSRNLNRRISRIQESAGLEDKKVSPHVLRHTAATFASNNGMNAFEVKEFFGWSEMETAARYVDASDRRIKEAFAENSPIKNMN